MTTFSKQHPLALTLLAMLLAFVAFPFNMYGTPYLILFGIIIAIWLIFVVVSFKIKPWKGLVALVAPIVLIIPNFFAGFWLSCRFGIFGGCL